MDCSTLYGLNAKILRFLRLYLVYILDSAIIILIAVLAVTRYSGEHIINGVIIAIIAKIVVILSFMIINKLFYPKDVAYFSFNTILDKIRK